MNEVENILNQLNIKDLISNDTNKNYNQNELEKFLFGYIL